MCFSSSSCSLTFPPAATGAGAGQVSRAASDCSGATGCHQFTIACSRTIVQGCLAAGQGWCRDLLEDKEKLGVQLSISQLRGAAVLGGAGQRWELCWHWGVLDKPCWDCWCHLRSQLKGQNCSSQPAQELWALCPCGGSWWGCWASLGPPWRGFFFTSLKLFRHLGLARSQCRADSQLSTENKTHSRVWKPKCAWAVGLWVGWSHLFMDKRIVSLLLLQQEDFTMDFSFQL